MEGNYNVGDHKLLAIVLALGEWWQWLEGAVNPFIVSGSLTYHPGSCTVKHDTLPVSSPQQTSPSPSPSFCPAVWWGLLGGEWSRKCRRPCKITRPLKDFLWFVCLCHLTSVRLSSRVPPYSGLHPTIILMAINGDEHQRICGSLLLLFPQ